MICIYLLVFIAICFVIGGGAVLGLLKVLEP
jgi:hypothetical protein